jgi:hypothetical protein
MRLLFICDSESLFRAYNQVLGTLTDRTIARISSASYIAGLIENKEDIVIIVGDEQMVNKWMWNVIRKDYLNPVIVLGNDEGEVFLRNNPAFKGGASKYHKYLGPPHALNLLLDAINNASPIYDDDSRKLLFERYGSPYMEDRLYRLIDHDLKLYDKAKDISVLEEALKYSNELGDKKLAEIFQTAISLRENDEIDKLQQIKQGVLNILRENRS